MYSSDIHGDINFIGIARNVILTRLPKNTALFLTLQQNKGRTNIMKIFIQCAQIKGSPSTNKYRVSSRTPRLWFSKSFILCLQSHVTILFSKLSGTWKMYDTWYKTSLYIFWWQDKSIFFTIVKNNCIFSLSRISCKNKSRIRFSKNDFYSVLDFSIKYCKFLD